MDATLPNELNALREWVSTLQATLAAVQQEYQQTVGQLKSENPLRRQKLQYFIQRYFGGTQNESLDPSSWNCCWPV